MRASTPKMVTYLRSDPPPPVGLRSGMHIGDELRQLARDVLDHLVDVRAAQNLWDHPDLDDWRYEVANGDTLRGFAEWLAAKAEE
jgi:hypothetical protein